MERGVLVVLYTQCRMSNVCSFGSFVKPYLSKYLSCVDIGQSSSSCLQAENHNQQIDKLKCPKPWQHISCIPNCRGSMSYEKQKIHTCYYIQTHASTHKHSLTTPCSKADFLRDTQMPSPPLANRRVALARARHAGRMMYVWVKKMPLCL